MVWHVWTAVRIRDAAFSDDSGENQPCPVIGEIQDGEMVVLPNMKQYLEIRYDRGFS